MITQLVITFKTIYYLNYTYIKDMAELEIKSVFFNCYSYYNTVGYIYAINVIKYIYHILKSYLQH